MSALAALWYFDGRPDAQFGCKLMLGAQKLYGLHAAGWWSNESVALGRRLMNVLPEDRFDRQPLMGAGGRIVLVADVRIDNRDELIRALSMLDTNARLLSDADILLAALERWDEECLTHLVGDYAFVRWHRARQQMVLARSPLGQRPLHYYWGNRFFAAASMPKGLHALAEVPYGFDLERVTKELAPDTDVGTKTFFSGVQRVEPGHVVTVTERGMVARRFWLPRRREILLKGPQEYAEALRERLDEAVRCRLRGGCDVATHLSSGFDSSAVAATAARLTAAFGRKVVAFTAAPREGFDGPTPPNRIADESTLAAATAALYPNMEHVLIRNPGKSPLDDLDRCSALFDQPMLPLWNFVWINGINDAARERHLDVLLTGDKGNITLSYDGLFLLPELFRQGRWGDWWRESRAIVRRRKLRWRGIAARTFGPWFPGALWAWIEFAFNGKYADVPDFSVIHPERVIKVRRRETAAHDGFQRRLSMLCGDDFGNWNKGVLGGWQIDWRDPTSDVRLIDFCLNVPTDQFLRDGMPRALARRALSDRVPNLVLEESKRGIQAADWHERLTAARDRVAAELDRIATCPVATQVLNLERLRVLVENWPADGWETDRISLMYQKGLLGAVAVGHFLCSVSSRPKPDFDGLVAGNGHQATGS